MDNCSAANNDPSARFKAKAQQSNGVGELRMSKSENSTLSVAEQLAEFFTAQTYADLPPKALEHAAMLVASTVASAALGSTLDSSKIIRALEVERGGNRQATAWFGAAEKLPVAAAARINATMSDAAASDDSDLRNIIHHGTTACAAALAVAEGAGATGEEVLAAIVMGYEATARINTVTLGSLQLKGFHGCVVASFAGAVAAAKLMKLDRTGMARAIALTATSVGGLHVAAAHSVAREYHAGNAAMMGVLAAQAAARGFIPEVGILEMKRGFFETFGDKPDMDAATRDLGSHWNILTNMGIKMVPGGSPFHAIAEAAAKAAIAGDIKPEQIETIDVRICYPFKGPANPTDLIGIAHSPAYFAAAGAADRDFTWIHAFPEKINDPRIRGLLPKVRVGDPLSENLDRFKSGAVATIITTDGRRFTETVYAPKGAAMLGIAWKDVESKYRALVPFAGLAEGNLEASLKAIRELHAARDVSRLVGLLR